MMVNYMSDVAEEMSWKSDKIRRDFAQHRLSAYSPDFTADEAVWDWPGKRSRPTNAWEQKPKSKRRCMYSSAG